MKEAVTLTSSIDLLKKLMLLLGLKNDYELAKLIGVKPNTMSSWKVRNSLPYNRILNLCNSYNIDLNTLFFDNYTKEEPNDEYQQIPILYIHQYWDYYFDLDESNEPKKPLPLAHFPGTLNFDLIIQIATEKKNYLNSTLFFTLCKKITFEELVAGTTYVIIVKNKGFLYAKLQLIDAHAILKLDLGDLNLIHINSKDILELFECKGFYNTN